VGVIITAFVLESHVEYIPSLRPSYNTDSTILEGVYFDMSPFEYFLIAQWEIIGGILVGYWDIPSIFRLAQTNSRMRGVIHLYWTRRWDIDSFLKRYWRDTPNVRAFMRAHRACIFGSGVHGFLGRVPEASLASIDICIRRSSLMSFCELMHTELYTLDRLFCRSTNAGDFVDYPPGVFLGEAYTGEGFRLRSKLDVHVLRYRRGVIGLSRSMRRPSVIDVYIIWTNPLDYVLTLPVSEYFI